MAYKLIWSPAARDDLHDIVILYILRTMNRNRLTLLLAAIILLGGGTVHSVYAGLQDNNLIEFSRGSYPNTRTTLMVWPPSLKIYQDGKVIHYEGDSARFFVSQLNPQQLDSLKKRLAGEKYLAKSRIIEMEGDLISFHGGISYIRYLAGDNEILLATEVKPVNGPWVQLTQDIWKYVPDDHEKVFYPDSIGVKVWQSTPDRGDQNLTVWPFSKQIRLDSKPKIISNPEIVHYMFERLTLVFMFFNWEFKENQKRYSLSLENAPGWFEQNYLTKALLKLRTSGVRVTER